MFEFWSNRQSKGIFNTPEQASLVEYLVSTCPLDPNQVTMRQVV